MMGYSLFYLVLIFPPNFTLIIIAFIFVVLVSHVIVVAVDNGIGIIAILLLLVSLLLRSLSTQVIVKVIDTVSAIYNCRRRRFF